MTTTAFTPHFLLHSRHHQNHLGIPLSQCKTWRLSTVNADYSVCPTYPPAVIVPKSVDDDTLRMVARFRQGGRFPVLCYYHQKNGMVRRLAALLLPRAGLLDKN